jgi:hypothetical protein
MDATLTRLTIELSEAQKKKLKMLAAFCDMTLKDFIIERTIGFEPNKETKKSFNDYKNKKNLTVNNSFEEFWKEINS